jgi:hypothetical protein
VVAVRVVQPAMDQVIEVAMVAHPRVTAVFTMHVRMIRVNVV